MDMMMPGERANGIEAPDAIVEDAPIKECGGRERFLTTVGRYDLPSYMGRDV